MLMTIGASSQAEFGGGWPASLCEWSAVVEATGDVVAVVNLMRTSIQDGGSSYSGFVEVDDQGRRQQGDARNLSCQLSD